MPQPNRFITARLSLRKGDKAEWESTNIILQNGEPGWESDTLKLKIGDGSTRWNDLNYLNEGFGGAFTHDGTVFPTYIDTTTMAIEWMANKFKQLEEGGIDDFSRGVAGDPQRFMVTIVAGSGGVASHDGGSFISGGTQINITASPFGGHVFDKWSGETSSIADINSESTTMDVSANQFVKANFKVG